MGKNFWKRLRQATQILCFFIFLVLFRLTDYSGADTIPYAVNILFRIDPLVGACVTLATQSFIQLLWPCILMVGLTLVLGRFFCGWICPMGTLIDLAGKGMGQGQKTGKAPKAALGFIKYALLAFLLVSSLFSVQFLGFFDPFALLVRGMAFGADPLFYALTTGVFDKIYLSGPAWLSDLTEPVYEILKSFVLPHKQGFFYLSFLSFFLLAGILALEIFGKRFWCKNICPLGALYGLVSKFSLLKRHPAKACKKCSLCETNCPMNAFETEEGEARGRLIREECTLCMDCMGYCPRRITTFKFGLPEMPQPVDISRRKLLAAGLAGVCLPVLGRTHALSKLPDNGLIRPPGALDEPDFLAVCVRCGECMKVCITNGLQPVGIERGIEAMFTPGLVPRLGYCEFNCTLCSQVCPTHAIGALPVKEKHAFVMGKAWFDKDRCLPYSENKNCIVCEEHCPVHKKAILFDQVKVPGDAGEIRLVKRPRVVEERCIGCGICENVCPVPGAAAIRVAGRDSRISPGSGYA
ncbi:MAG: 4Fe-4S binding protein [Proteobacteria bacterium]|nr:4Fe-4S binding protein [Desulfobacula sp.]MBU3953258.1 4Fe-4S binding protein [Pseudomonadota bacterium]